MDEGRYLVEAEAYQGFEQALFSGSRSKFDVSPTRTKVGPSENDAVVGMGKIQLAKGTVVRSRSGAATPPPEKYLNPTHDCSI